MKYFPLDEIKLLTTPSALLKPLANWNSMGTPIRGLFELNPSKLMPISLYYFPKAARVVSIDLAFSPILILFYRNRITNLISSLLEHYLIIYWTISYFWSSDPFPTGTLSLFIDWYNSWSSSGVFDSSTM